MEQAIGKRWSEMTIHASRLGAEEVGLSGLEGLGFLIFRAQGLLLTDQLLVCMVIIGLVGFAIDRSMFLAQKRVLKWKQGYDG